MLSDSTEWMNWCLPLKPFKEGDIETNKNSFSLYFPFGACLPASLTGRQGRLGVRRIKKEFRYI